MHDIAASERESDTQTETTLCIVLKPVTDYDEAAKTRCLPPALQCIAVSSFLAAEYRLVSVCCGLATTVLLYAFDLYARTFKDGAMKRYS